MGDLGDAAIPGVDAGQRCDLGEGLARQRLFGLRQLLSNLAEQRHLLS
jgi:hypothetical protein